MQLNFSKLFIRFAFLFGIFIAFAVHANAHPGLIYKSTQRALIDNPAKDLNLFSVSEERYSEIDAAINHVVYLKLNKEVLSQAHNNKYATLSFSLPLGNSLSKISMSKYNIFASDFVAKEKRANGEVSLPLPDGVFYRGFVNGQTASVAAISFFENEIGGIISILGEHGNFNLVLNKENPGDNFDNYILFRDVDIVDPERAISLCKNGSLEESHPGFKKSRKTGAGENGLSCKTVSIAFYGDYKLYQKNQNSVTNSQNYLTTLFNGVAAIFENDNIRVALKQLSVSSVNDSFPTNTSNAVLFKFGNNIGTAVTADLMQLVTAHTVTSGPNIYAPLGGVAWLNVLCSQPYYYSAQSTFVGAFSIINTTGNPNIPSVPTYSWDVYCSIHEMGHNLGSPHTHSCEWNGNNTAIDGCGPTYNVQYIDGNCSIGPIPTSGTIMSYCHLLSGVGVNLASGFGPQPSELIRTKIGDALCLSTDYMPDSIINTATQTAVANSFCTDGNTLYCYENSNDFDRTNDQLVLIISNPNISNLNLNNVAVSMTTSPTYGTSSAVPANTYAYLDGAYEQWFEGNRSWAIDLGATLNGSTSYVFPYLNQDRTDLGGSFPALNNSNDSLRLITFKAINAAQDHSLANPSEVEIYNNGLQATNWNYANGFEYKKATIVTTNPIFGATFAAGKLKSETNIRSNGLKINQLKLYPNPTNNQLLIESVDPKVLLSNAEIIDILGRKTTFNLSPANAQILDLSPLAKGVYRIQCATNKGIFISTFIKL